MIEFTFYTLEFWISLFTRRLIDFVSELFKTRNHKPVRKISPVNKKYVASWERRHERRDFRKIGGQKKDAKRPSKDNFSQFSGKKLSNTKKGVLSKCFGKKFFSKQLNNATTTTI